jgi:hypothetical protein
MGPEMLSSRASSAISAIRRVEHHPACEETGEVVRKGENVQLRAFLCVHHGGDGDTKVRHWPPEICTCRRISQKVARKEMRHVQQSDIPQLQALRARGQSRVLPAAKGLLRFPTA